MFAFSCHGGVGVKNGRSQTQLRASFLGFKGLPQAAFAICTSARVMGESSMASGTPLSCAARAAA